MSDYEAAATDAISQLEALDGSAQADAPVAETPVAEAAAEPAAETPAATPQVAALADDALVEVLVNGEVRQLPWKEAKASIMMQQDYTRKTQEIAEVRKQTEAYVTAQREREAQINALLQDPARLSAYLQKLQGQAPDPTEPVTVEAMQAQLAAAQQQFQQQIQQQVLAAKTDIEIAQEAKGVRSQLDTTWQTLFTSHPQLKAIPQLKGLIEAEIQSMNLSSVEDAQRAIAAKAQTYADSLNAHYQTQRKAEVVEQAKLKTGIEPPGGKGITPSPYKAKSLDDPQFVKNLEAEIQALMNG